MFLENSNILQPWLVLRWMTILGYTILICNQPLRPTHFPPYSGMGNEYGQGAVAVLSGWKGNRRSGVALAMHHRLCGSVWYINLWAQWPKEGR